MEGAWHLILANRRPLDTQVTMCGALGNCESIRARSFQSRSTSSWISLSSASKHHKLAATYSDSAKRWTRVYGNLGAVWPTALAIESAIAVASAFRSPDGDTVSACL